jgi:1-deoxy-D-xylulose-5-phosphate synthase
VRNLKGPVLVHTITKKGKGYKFAEEDEQKYHGVGKFDKAEGIKVVPPSVPTYTSVFGDTLVELASRDRRIHAITAAMPDGTGLNAFRAAYPDRFFDVGIAEQHAVTFAAGLASGGMRPVVAIYSTFLQRAYDQLIHDVALQKLPVVFALDRAGLVGEDGPTHHGAFDLSYLRPIPGAQIMAPKDEDELRHMLASALAYDAGPCFLRYPRGSGLGVSLTGSPQILAMGEAEILEQGEDICLLAIGSMVAPAMEAANRLGRLGLSATVVNMRFVKPLPEQTLAEVWPTHRMIVTLEENSIVGGLGGAVLEWSVATNQNSNVKVLNLGLPDQFIEHATRSELLTGIDLQGEQICERLLADFEQLEANKRRQSAS